MQLGERERVLSSGYIWHRERVPPAKSRRAVDKDKVEGGDIGCVVVDDADDALAWDSVFIVTDLGEEPLAGRIGGGILNEFPALGGVLVLKGGVHRDSERTAGFGEVQMDVRDTNEFTDEGCIIAADVGNIIDVGVGGDPEVAENDREYNFEPVTADKHPLCHGVTMSVTAG